jgi:hypothetical protein
MPICASCGQPVEAARARRSTCPSCTWRAAIRLSQTATADEADSPDLTHTASGHAAFIEVGDDPETLVTQLQEFAAAAADPLHDHRARRVYIALMHGNTRPYEAEMNRLVARYIERLEETWT